MLDSSHKHNLYRILTMALAVYLVAIALGNFHRYSTSTTDENLFATAPSRLYFAHSVEAANAGQTFGANRPASDPDSARVGDLLISIEGYKTRTLPEFRQAIKNLPADTTARIRVFRPVQGKLHRMQISAAMLTDSLVTEMSGAVHVNSVTSGGASDLAGLSVGDLIVRINGETFYTANGADLILRRARSGSTILYDIIRGGKHITLPVTLARWGFQVAIFLSFLTGLAFWAVGAFLAINRPQIKAALLLGVMFMLFGFVIMTLLSQRDVVFDLFAGVRTVTMVGAFLFGLAIWPHSRLTFPLELPDLPVKRWYVFLPYSLAGFFLLVFASMTLWNLGSTTAARAMVSGATILLTLHAIYVGFRLRKVRSAQYKTIARWLNWAVIVALALATLTSFLLIRFSGPGQFGLMLINLLIIPVTFLYTIGRYQLLEMNLRVRRNVQYSIISALWFTALIAGLIRLLILLPGLYMDIPNIQFTGTSFIVLDLPPDPTVHEFWERLAIIVLTLVLAWLTWRIRNAGQRQIDRLFNRGAYNLSRATSELAEIMATRLGMDDLAKGIIEKLAKLMELKRVGVMFFRDEKACCCRQAHGFDGTQWDNLCVSSSDRLISEIKRFRSESRFSIDYLPHDIKEVFLTEGFRHVIPIRFKNRLVGTFIIGEKLSESPLHIEDLTFLAAVAKQASIAIENAFLHEELTEQERLKHELHIARRIQMASLPQTTPQIEGLDISGTSIPALEVGGDYFDYLNGVAEGLTIIVGDVSGKGTSAALYMSKVQGIIRSLHAFNLSPRELFVRANHLLCDDMEKKSFITALGAFIDTAKRRLVLARAGHLPLFSYNAKSQAVSLITPKGLGLGLGMNADDIFAKEIEETELDYSSGDIFLFVTDGVTEAQTANGGEFGEDKLSELLRSSAALSADDIRDRVISEVKHFAEDQLPHDDQTVVVVKIR